MKHHMSLLEDPFNKIKDKTKFIEVRLNDEKRQKVNIGDTIVFSKLPTKEEQITVEVIDKYKCKTFEELYNKYDFSLFGCEEYTINQMINETYEIYSKEQEELYGVLGIAIKLI